MTDPKRFDYVAEANVTCSNQFHGELISREVLRMVLMSCIENLRRLDVIKKTLFYGRPLADPNKSFAPAENEANANTFLARMLPGPFNPQQLELLTHGIVGKATECGELLEALYAAAFESKPLDPVNLEEETGDGHWYDAIIAQACGFTFEACQHRNIAKLRHRFPNAFTEFDALNRDLFGERKILETKPSDASEIIREDGSKPIPNFEEAIPGTTAAMGLLRVMQHRSHNLSPLDMSRLQRAIDELEARAPIMDGGKVRMKTGEFADVDNSAE